MFTKNYGLKKQKIMIKVGFPTKHYMFRAKNLLEQQQITLPPVATLVIFRMYKSIHQSSDRGVHLHFNLSFFM